MVPAPVSAVGCGHLQGLIDPAESSVFAQDGQGLEHAESNRLACHGNPQRMDDLADLDLLIRYFA